MTLITIKSRCTCGQEFFVEVGNGIGTTCRNDGKRVYPADKPDTGWDTFRCPRCHEVVADTVPGAEYEVPYA